MLVLLGEGKEEGGVVCNDLLDGVEDGAWH